MIDVLPWQHILVFAPGGASPSHRIKPSGGTAVPDSTRSPPGEPTRLWSDAPIASALRPAADRRRHRRLVREMAVENLLWGAPRIHGELVKYEQFGPASFGNWGGVDLSFKKIAFKRRQ